MEHDADINDNDSRSMEDQVVTGRCGDMSSAYGPNSGSCYSSGMLNERKGPPVSTEWSEACCFRGDGAGGSIGGMMGSEMNELKETAGPWPVIKLVKWIANTEHEILAMQG